MSKKSVTEDLDIDNDFTYSGSVGPTRKRLSTRGGPRVGRPNRVKKSSSQRKGNTKGGIHQRGNKRMSW